MFLQYSGILFWVLAILYYLLKKKYLIEIPERTSLPNIFYTILLNGVVDILQRIPIQLIGAGNLRQLCIFWAFYRCGKKFFRFPYDKIDNIYVFVSFDTGNVYILGKISIFVIPRQARIKTKFLTKRISWKRFNCNGSGL